MTKKEFFAEVAVRAGLTEEETKQIFGAMQDVICNKLKTGEEVNLSGFGKFFTKYTPARMVQNRLGHTMSLRAMYKPEFEPGKILKDAAKEQPVPKKK